MRLSSIVFTLLLATVVMGQPITEKEVSFKGSYGEKNFKKAPKRVYISKFQVLFNVSASATAKSAGGRTFGGGSMRASTTTHMAVAVDGLDIPDFQAIADETYNRFVGEMKALGYEIVQPEEAGKTEYYADWIRKEGGQANYANVPGYVSVTPTGYSYFIKKETSKGREKDTFLDKSPLLSRDLNDALVAEVVFAFPLIEMDADGGIYSAGSSVKAKIDYKIGSAFGQDGLTAIIEPTLVKLVSGKGPGLSAEAYFYSALKKPISSEKPVFAEKTFKERTLGGTKPMYYGIVFQDNESTEVTHTAKADRDLYISESKRFINEYLNVVMASFKENLN